MQLVGHIGYLCYSLQNVQLSVEFFLLLLQSPEDGSNLRNVIRQNQTSKDHNNSHKKCLFICFDGDIAETDCSYYCDCPINTINVLTGPSVVLDAEFLLPVFIGMQMSHT